MEGERGGGGEREGREREGERERERERGRGRERVHAIDLSIMKDARLVYTLWHVLHDYLATRSFISVKLRTQVCSLSECGSSPLVLAGLFVIVTQELFVVFAVRVRANEDGGYERGGGGGGGRWEAGGCVSKGKLVTEILQTDWRRFCIVIHIYSHVRRLIITCGKTENHRRVEVVCLGW